MKIRTEITAAHVPEAFRTEVYTGPRDVEIESALLLACAQDIAAALDLIFNSGQAKGPEELPSLSVGDVIYYAETAWEILAYGFMDIATGEKIPCAHTGASPCVESLLVSGERPEAR